MKFIHITDTHLVEAGALLYELDPLDRLERCIASINRDHGDAEFAIITGDLAHSGRLPAYHALKGALGRLRLKTWLMLGNHDKREHFLQVFPDSPRDADGFIQYTFDIPIGRCICLDTNHPEVPWGLLCEKRLAWLKAELARAGDMPVYLFMHHPPFAVGIKRMDENSLREPGRFAAVIAGSRNIRHLFFGHLHRPVGGSWRGIPVTTMRGTNHQVALDFVLEGRTPGSHEPPAYAVVLADADQTVVHFHDYLDGSKRFLL